MWLRGLLGRNRPELERRCVGRFELVQIDVARACQPHELHALFFFYLPVVYAEERSVRCELRQAYPWGLGGGLYGGREIRVIGVLLDGVPEVAACQGVDIPVGVDVTAEVGIACFRRRDHLPLIEARTLRTRGFAAQRGCCRAGLFLPFRGQATAADFDRR